jgi:hypothetical protein
MQQVTLDLDDSEDTPPGPVIAPERQHQLISLMADAILAVVQHDPGENHEPN